MKVLVIGSGGREHALAWKIGRSPLVERVFCAPGNGGTASIADNVTLAADDLPGLTRFALDRSIDLTVVGPELPLVLGIVDRFRSHGLSIVGPTAAAARLEGSKIFAKDFMKRHQVPTAACVVCNSFEEAMGAIRRGDLGFPLVVKADGLAAGKGVVIAQDRQQAESAVEQMMRRRVFGEAGERVLLEECLRGREASFLVFSDGEHFLPMVPSQDHKRVFDRDRGPNTGGMGAYSTDGILSSEEQQEVVEAIVGPTIRGMAVEGNEFSGVLYVGLMLTPDGIKVLEYNVRLGDPEAQPVLFRLENDLVEVLQAIHGQTLDSVRLRWDSACSVCVVLASGGYPGKYPTGKSIQGIDDAEAVGQVTVFHAGTRLQDGQLVTSGGRVLGVTAKDADLPAAVARVYRALEKVRFEPMHFRTDIGRHG
ncbi:MAG: phosphoribosylamine--glycine ligase [Acidobacteria bacterium]|nr:phosphoribosylamine--glycine ligase [Acidobacteriota bacterium]MYC82779.1 phosphoribosylamine--glycine ligase [Acidobacteriota bacterium]